MGGASAALGQGHRTGRAFPVSPHDRRVQNAVSGYGRLRRVRHPFCGQPAAFAGGAPPPPPHARRPARTPAHWHHRGIRGVVRVPAAAVAGGHWVGSGPVVSGRGRGLDRGLRLSPPPKKKQKAVPVFRRLRLMTPGPQPLSATVAMGHTRSPFVTPWARRAAGGGGAGGEWRVEGEGAPR